MPLSAGTRLGPYEIGSLLGVGGMGEVYRATDTKLGRQVALKVLPPALASDAQYMARFQREAQVLASLNHPNIAAIYGLEESGGVRALVMELVEGPTLAERIATGALPLPEALTVARQIAEALEAAHEKGVTHRDLKPANVKITPEGVVKVLDFGLAKTVEQPVPSSDPANSPTLTISLTQVGTIMGTAAYMSPEQARGKPVDRRADIWAFGVVFYEMLTGRDLYGGGETMTDTLAAVVTREPDWTALPRDTPPRIRRLLAQCLRKEQKSRLQAIGDARITIDEPDDQPAPVIATPSRKPIWILGAIAALTTLAAVWALLPKRTVEQAPAVTRFHVGPPEKASFQSSGPAISPDGRRLATSTSGADGIRQLWIRELDSLTGRLLPGISDLSGNAFWSPDSRSIGFLAGGKLKRIDISGGPPQTLCDAPVGQGASWNRDGVIVFTPNTRDPLYRVPVSGGAPTPVTELDASSQEVSHRWPWFLPDGRHFLFFSRSVQSEKSGIYVASLGSKDRKRLLSAISSPAYAPSADPAHGHILFRSDTVLMAQPFDAIRLELTGDPFPVAERVLHTGVTSRTAFSVSGNGVLAFLGGDEAQVGAELVWLDRSGKSLGPAGPGRGTFAHPRLSPDQKRVAVGRADPQLGGGDIWLLDFARAIFTRFTFDPAGEGHPLWSPDGTHVAWAVSRDGSKNIYRKAASGDGQDELLAKGGPDMYPWDWSPDGRYLVYSSAEGESRFRDIWALPLEGDRKPVRIIQSNFHKDQAQFSPDGRWLVYTSNESGSSQIYGQRFQPGGLAAGSGSGGKWQISTAGGVQPRWRRDGKELFYLALDRKMMAVPVQTSGSFQPGVPGALFQMRVSQSALTATELAYQYDVTADGGRFLAITPSGDNTPQPLTVVLNWAAGVKK